MSIALHAVLWAGGFIMGAGALMLMFSIDSYRAGKRHSGQWAVPGCLLALGLFMTTAFFALRVGV